MGNDLQRLVRNAGRRALGLSPVIVLSSLGAGYHLGGLSWPWHRARLMLGDMLAFGSLVERAMEVFLVTLLGVVLLEHWDWQGLIVAGALFCIFRPLSVFLTPLRQGLDAPQRGLLGWLGIKGIGGLYYLFYAINHGLPPSATAQSSNLVLSVVALSILVHGLSVQSLLARYQARRKRTP